jgi:hypothetical protein
LSVARYADKINQFLGQVFHTLNNTFDDVEVDKICGIFGGLGYQRTASPYEAKDFNSGKCKSYLSFEKGSMPRGIFLQINVEPTKELWNKRMHDFWPLSSI